MKKPLVSIVIPVFNGENYLKDAIDSAINQTYSNCEIIVVNDGSSDATEKIAKSYGKKIRYYKKENGGVASALNYGVAKMNGEYFSWLSHDDMYHKEKIAKEITALREKKLETTIITCGYARIDENGDFIDNKAKKIYTPENEKYSDEELSRPLFALLSGGCIFGCSLLIHKSHFDRVGTFNEALLTNDYDLWFRMMRNERLIYLRENLAYKRIHSEQDTNTKNDFIGNIWLAYYLYCVNKLPDDELSIVFGSRQGFFDDTKRKFGFDDEYQTQLLSAQTRDEVQYILFNKTFKNKYEETINRSNTKIENLNNEIKSLKSSYLFKIFKRKGNKKL